MNFQKKFEQPPRNGVNYPNRFLCRRVGPEQGLWFAPVAGAITLGGEGQKSAENFF
jgi:hypothetical protein